MIYYDNYQTFIQVKQTQLDKEQIAEEIAHKLGYAPGVSYSEIALKAADCGRIQLAIKVGCFFFNFRLILTSQTVNSK